MSDSQIVLLYFFIGFLGVVCTIGYWFGRYCFMTDDEPAEIGQVSKPDDVNQD